MKPRNGSLLALTALVTACHGEPFQARFAVRGRWPPAREIVYRLDSQDGALEPTEFARSIRSALDEWAATGCATFREARPGEAPALLFAWARDDHEGCVPFGTDPSVAHAGPVGPGTFVHFDADRSWESLALRQAALHEIGHVLGLDHSPDEEAVMYPEPSPARAHLARSDLAGIHSLYGGGDSARGDLVVAGGDADLVLLTVAPPELCDWTLFDTDGDGDTEVVVWRTDARGNGALWSYHFVRGPVLQHTLGPLYGQGGPGFELELLGTANGERLLILQPQRGEPSLRVFDAHGAPRPFEGELPMRAGAGASPRPQQGDLDGDGTLETVTRHE